jgi:hypothetical protein
VELKTACDVTNVSKAAEPKIPMSGPEYRLATVNTAPERAKRLIGRVAGDVKNRYSIVHVVNVESELHLTALDISDYLSPGIEDVKTAVEREHPDVLVSSRISEHMDFFIMRTVQFTASMWTPEQAKVHILCLKSFM